MRFVGLRPLRKCWGWVLVLLSMQSVNVLIKNLHVLRNVAIDVGKGESIMLIGRNGAGKSSTLKSIIGIYPTSSGKIIFDGEDITNLPPHVRAAMKGIGYSPEDSRVFPDLTVEENILLPTWLTNRKYDGDFMEIVLNIFPELKKLLKRKGLFCSGGEKKMVSISRTLALKPKLLLLDEAMEGLAPLVVRRFKEAFKEIENMGISMIMAESNFNVALTFNYRTYVIDRGEIIYNGDVEGIKSNQAVLSVIRGY